MPRSTDVKGIERNDDMSDDSKVLEQLVHNESMWEQSEPHESAFQRLKDKATSTPLLKYCEVSASGLGAALRAGDQWCLGSGYFTFTEIYIRLALIFRKDTFH